MMQQCLAWQFLLPRITLKNIRPGKKVKLRRRGWQLPSAQRFCHTILRPAAMFRMSATKHRVSGGPELYECYYCCICIAAYGALLFSGRAGAFLFCNAESKKEYDNDVASV